MEVYKHSGEHELSEENWGNMVISSPEIYSQVHVTKEAVERVKFLNNY